VKLLSYDYWANIVLSFSFPGKNCLLSFLLSRFYIIVPGKNCLFLFLLSRFCIIVPGKNLFVLTFTVSFLLSRFYIIVPRKNLFVLAFAVSFLPSRSQKNLFSVPWQQKVGRCIARRWAMRLVLFFLSFSSDWTCSIFFIWRWRLAAFLDDSFKFFLFSRTFHMEKDKNVENILIKN
jgi:hypothetical protein